MKMTIRTWSKADNTIVIHLTWNSAMSLRNGWRNLGTVMEGDTVAAYHFPALAQPIPASMKQYAIDLVRSSGWLASINDLTLN